MKTFTAERGEITVLREARDLVAAGWTQGFGARYGEHGTSWCITGAVYAACQIISADWQQRQRAFDLLSRQLNLPYWGLVAWNDAPERTQAEVLAAIDKTIDAAGTEG